MSYDIELKDPIMGTTIVFEEPHQMHGGMYQIGGTAEAWLNITYNYSGYYYDATESDSRFFGKTEDDYEEEEPRNLGIRGIYGKTGAESIPMLRDMILRITEKYSKDGKWIDGEGPNDDYWESTAANAVRPLLQLVALARIRPDGIWEGD